MNTAERACQECGDILRGRSDQKFCSDQCRTSFNNKLNRDSLIEVRNVNNILRKNRRILVELGKGGKSKIRKEILLHLGFNFSFHTSSLADEKGRTCFYCYDLGYSEIDENLVLLVQNQIRTFRF